MSIVVLTVDINSINSVAYYIYILTIVLTQIGYVIRNVKLPKLAHKIPHVKNELTNGKNGEKME